MSSEALGLGNIQVSGQFLLGLPQFLASAQKKAKQKAKVELVKFKPIVAENDARGLIAQKKAETKLAKVNSAIRTANAAEAKKAQGTPAQIQAAQDQVDQALIELTPVLALLAVANENLADKVIPLTDQNAELDDATVELARAMADWLDAESSDEAQDLRAALDLLLATAAGMVQVLRRVPDTAEDGLQVYTAAVVAWRTNLTEAASACNAALAAWGGGATEPESALVEALNSLLAIFADLDSPLNEYAAAALVAQSAQDAVNLGLEKLQGAQEVLDGLQATGSSRSALRKATDEHMALMHLAQAAAAQAGQSKAFEAALTRRADGG